MRSLRVLLSVTLLGLAAWAQDPAVKNQVTDKSDTKATVYVYRYKQFTGSALAPSVYCDEVQLAKMENGRYFSVRIDPGKHVFHSNDKQSGVELDLQAGQQYFIRLEIAAGFMKGHGRLLLVAPEQGRYELSSSKLKPLDADKVVDAGLVSVEQAHLDASAK
ncbi:MAG TPA: DUF2846 domain-containing protein [Dongiaceae bacterium]|nr:DUF2846 domain-containing protein [Dongiaceae bacterium]